MRFRGEVFEELSTVAWREGNAGLAVEALAMALEYVTKREPFSVLSAMSAFCPLGHKSLPLVKLSIFKNWYPYSREARPTKVGQI